MHTSTSDRLTAAAAEQLLDGGAGPAGLAPLLAAAAGPATASELSGEAAAVAAFADAPRVSRLPGAPSRRPSMLSVALSKLLAAKALAVVVLLAGATGGVALAATVSSQPAAPSADPPAAPRTPLPTAPPEPVEDHPAPAARGTAHGADTTAQPAPEPSLAALCTAWGAGATTGNPGAAAENPAFRALVKAAGSPGEVPGYCVGLQDTDPHARPGTSDSGNGEHREHPDGPPTAAPGHPTGPPTDAPERNSDEHGDRSRPEPGGQDHNRN
jgi:hypothetical protein